MRTTRDYRRGLELARALVASTGRDPDLAAEGINTLATGIDRLYRLRDAWDRLGCPALALGSKGQDVPHPLIGAIEAAERDVTACEAALTRRQVGRHAGSASAPDRTGRPPKLRKVT